MALLPARFHKMQVRSRVAYAGAGINDPIGDWCGCPKRPQVRRASPARDLCDSRSDASFDAGSVISLHTPAGQAVENALRFLQVVIVGAFFAQSLFVLVQAVFQKRHYPSAK
jgi:hypothetical protein